MESVEVPRVDPGLSEEGRSPLASVGSDERERRKEQDEQMSMMSYGAA